MNVKLAGIDSQKRGKDYAERKVKLLARKYDKQQTRKRTNRQNETKVPSNNSLEKLIELPSQSFLFFPMKYLPILSTQPLLAPA
jgi:hypothetical protein